MNFHMHDLGGYEAFQVWTMTFVTTTWFFAIGAALGSFLNVIVYRMPLNISLSKQGSRCPNCLTDIRMTDNVPIFGWLRLRGRCRACDWPIPARYPIVEGLVAFEFVALAFVELIGAGWNLPFHMREHYLGVVDIIWSLRSPELFATYGLHCCLLFFQLAMALIDIDGHRIPRRLAVVAFGIVLTLLVIFPAANPVSSKMPVFPWQTEDLVVGEWLASIPRLEAVLKVSLGAGCGLAFAQWPFLGTTDDERRRHSVMLMLALAGAGLGWQSAFSIGVMTTAAVAISRLLSRLGQQQETLHISALVGIFTFVHIVAWRLLTSVSWWPGAKSSAVQLTVVMAATIVLAVVCKERRID